MFVSKILAGKYEEIKINELLSDSFFSQTTLKPFNQKTIDFFSSLSNNLLKDKISSSNPDLVSLGFWLRKSNIDKIKNNFLAVLDKNQLAVPRGIAFHIAPSNVDTIFMYSLSFSMLAGNHNIVRISQNINPQMQRLLEIINNTMCQPEFEEIAKRNFVISYPHSDEIGSYLSLKSDIRIIWGGDSTVNKIRSFPSKPTTKDISFADKVSYTIINSENYLNCNEKELKSIAHNFFNDAYYFNQLGCSSPRIVYFIGKNEDSNNASLVFWDELGKELKSRQYEDEPSVAINKLVEKYSQAAKGIELKIFTEPSNQKASVIRIEKNAISQCRETCGGGFFYECFLGKLSDIQPYVQSNDQTLTYFGFEKDNLKDLVINLNGKGIDRIVPIGMALAFSTVWDGYDLLNEVTKRISII